MRNKRSEDIKVIAEQLLKKANVIKRAKDLPNPLNEMKNSKAKREITKILDIYSKGFFKDEYWKPIHDTINGLNSLGIPTFIDKSKYEKEKDGTLKGKRWWVESTFIDDRGKEKTIYILIVASGTGSVEEPLDRYDVVSYVTHIR